MTLANKITIIRICMIPTFTFAALAYEATVAVKSPDERLRWIVTAIFTLAAATDGVDGLIARRFNQQTRLGAILDPVADKGLVFTALILLTPDAWSNGFPLWFPIFVIGRDLILIGSFLVLSVLSHSLNIQASLAGKLATTLQIVSIIWVLSGFQWIDLLFPVALATVLTLVSGIGYTIDGINQVTRHRNC